MINDNDNGKGGREREETSLVAATPKTHFQDENSRWQKKKSQ
jgi:hypothetical protein